MFTFEIARELIKQIFDDTRGNVIKLLLPKETSCSYGKIVIWDMRH